MKFTSTRSDITVTLSTALKQGIAPDGGLYVPTELPTYTVDDFTSIDDLNQIAKSFLAPFFSDDNLEKMLDQICEETFSFPIPLRELPTGSHILELFHGPTGAFKDVGARFLAQCLSKIEDNLLVLVATSGDTGSAVAASFYRQSGVQVIILYPKDKISEFQEKQLTFWDENVLTLRIRGDFDKCQQLVKLAFHDQRRKQKYGLTSANSINIGRLLPQCVYYVQASLQYYRQYGKAPNLIIPTGNMGNALAAIWVKQMGLPISHIWMATNENTSIPEYFASGEYHPQPSIATLANAMDVGDPSNMERYLHLVEKNQEIEKEIFAVSVSDEHIAESITEMSKSGVNVCPHTATAVYVQQKYKIEDAILIATADPFKFKSIVSKYSVLGVEPSAVLRPYLDSAIHVTEIPADLEELFNQIERFREYS